MAKRKSLSVNATLIKRGILEYLEKMEPGCETGFWEIKHAVDEYIDFELDSACMFDGTSIQAVKDALKSLERAGKIGWACAIHARSPHYYLVSQRLKNPGIAETWVFSEYEKGSRKNYPRVLQG